MAGAHIVESVSASASAEPLGEGLVEASFDFYGIGLTVVSEVSSLVDSLAKDFAYFVAPSQRGAIRIVAHADDPPWSIIPDKIASMITPNAISYDDQEVRYNDYHRQLLGKYDFANERGELWSRDLDLLYEITYLMALSRVGELHDRRGIHRIHALGIAIADRGALVLLPEAGGKTTLALELLKKPAVKILSDDTPLLANQQLLAFPTRMGIRGKVDGIALEHLRTFKRRNHGPKTLIDLSYFRDRVIDRVSPKVVIVGTRSSGDKSRIASISRVQALPALAANLVFGLGLPQVLEYFIRARPSDLLKKGSIASSRLLAALRLVSRTDCYRLVLGRDVAGAADAVESVLRIRRAEPA
jgi:hypothetical protein